MANELGPFPAPGSVAVYNPDDATEVRQVSGAGAPAWVAKSHALAEITTALAQDGTSGDYYAGLPAGLDAGRAYTLKLLPAGATVLADPAATWHLYEPEGAGEGGGGTTKNVKMEITELRGQ